MSTVAGLFHDRQQALRALETLRADGFSDHQLALVSSPTSASETVDEAAQEFETSVGGFIDFGAAPGGQPPDTFPQQTRRRVESGVAQADVLVRVSNVDGADAQRAQDILRSGGANEIVPD